jgi:hypothetical protein
MKEIERAANLNKLATSEKDSIIKNAEAVEVKVGDIVSLEKKQKPYGALEVSYKRNK